MNWQPISTAPENVVVNTRINDEHGIRNEAKLKKSRNLWWYPDMHMYVYYAPTEWADLYAEATK